ncbi:MAG TPA: hypothetical protein PLK82_11540 [Bacteroidales bacterium]|nr:hypothetical protein [Bacteroidales bacterium]
MISTAQAAAPQQVNPTLYPPQNFEGLMIECMVYLHWQKPQQPGGTTPPGLVGYYLYRDGILRHYCPSGDSLSFYDYEFAPYGTTYIYTLTANYDLAYYGNPGQFGESPVAGPVNITSNCDFILPFYEPWDLGTFTYQDWSFLPAQGNWHVITSQGNPFPSAAFQGLPATLGYDFLLRSLQLPGKEWACASMSFDFDVKLNDLAAGGTEKLLVQYFLNNQWFTVLELTNNGSTDWIHYSFDISDIAMQTSRIGFRAQGQNSQNIGSWLIDNILVQPHCFGPQSCGFVREWDTIHLFWQPPACDSVQYCFGYNLYRTTGTGLPPFSKLNAAPVTSIEYSDVIPSSVTSGVFGYIITALQKIPNTGEFLCEAPCDTLYVDYLAGMAEGRPGELSISPNPSSGFVRVKSPAPMDWCEIRDITGRNARACAVKNHKEITLPVADLPEGLYFIRVTCRERLLQAKVMIGK